MAAAGPGQEGTSALVSGARRTHDGADGAVVQGAAHHFEVVAADLREELRALRQDVAGLGAVEAAPVVREALDPARGLGADLAADALGALLQALQEGEARGLVLTAWF